MARSHDTERRQEQELTGESEHDFTDPVLRGVTHVSEPGDARAWLRSPLPSVDQVIDGKYRIVRDLGRGGMGAVFEAVHTWTGERVALKWLLPTPGRDTQETNERLLSEARAAVRVRHANVVALYDAGAAGDGVYIVMERLEGETLRSRIHRGALSPGEALEIFLPVLSGLSHIHGKGVIHRDLKPDNVFLCRDDRGHIEPKILDFGVAKALSPLGAQFDVTTHPGTFVGTVMYAPIERLRDAPASDHRADIYAVGVMLFEALTTLRPYRAKNLADLILEIAEGGVVGPRALRPELSPSLDAVVTRAMAPDAADRYPDAEAFAAALRDASSQSAVSRPLVLSERSPAAATPRPFAARLVLWGFAAAALAASVWGLRAAPSEEGGNERHVPLESAHVSRGPATPLPGVLEPVTPKLAKPAPLEPAKAAAVEPTVPARLSVVVIPYGKVWLDTRKRGEAPLTIDVSPGRHVVSAGPDVPDVSQEISLAPGEKRKIVLRWGRFGKKTPSP